MTFYTIGELANLTGVSIKTIRYYDEVKLLQPLKKSAAGYRLYSLAEAQRLQYIMTFRLMGFSIMEIQQILLGEADVNQAAQLQLQAMEKQIQSLHRIQVLLEGAIANNLLQSPELITQIGEELKMTEQQRMETLVEQFRQIMLRDCHSEEWAEKMFKKHEEMLCNLKLDTKEKMDAFYELKNLLSDPEYVQETQHSMGDFWSMVNDNEISPDEWDHDMGGLFERVKQAANNGLAEDSPEIQGMVDEWMQIISKNIKIPINKQFMVIFKEKVDAMYGSPKQKQYWEVLSVLDPTSAQIHEATKLMIRGMNYKLSQV